MKRLLDVILTGRGHPYIQEHAKFVTMENGKYYGVSDFKLHEPVLYFDEEKANGVFIDNKIKYHLLWKQFLKRLDAMHKIGHVGGKSLEYERNGHSFVVFTIPLLSPISYDSIPTEKKIILPSTLTFLDVIAKS